MRPVISHWCRFASSVAVRFVSRRGIQNRSSIFTDVNGTA
jgi:hypothetical protein